MSAPVDVPECLAVPPARADHASRRGRLEALAAEYRHVRVSAACQRFACVRARAAEALLEARTARYCDECGFRRPGHAHDCRQVFWPVAFVSAPGRAWRYSEEAGIATGDFWDIRDASPGASAFHDLPFCSV